MKKDVDSFMFEGKPCSKPRMVRSDSWKKRPVVMKYWAFRDEINLAADKQGFALGDSHRVRFYIEMPKSWSKKKKTEMVNKPHKQRPDLDNLCKGLWDSLLEEDSGCYYLVASKRWAIEPMIHIENYPDNLDF